jgi:Rieske Fe-S protein
MDSRADATEAASSATEMRSPQSAAADGGVGARRRFLSAGASLAMAGGLAAGYGTFAYMGGRYLFPDSSGRVGWQFVARVNELAPGESLNYTAPSGAQVVIARQSEGETGEDFLALSSVCPHLGCQVHLEPQHARFFCPCHNGAFDLTGEPIAGPPKDANQKLTRFPLKVEAGLLYVEAPLVSVAAETA